MRTPLPSGTDSCACATVLDRRAVTARRVKRALDLLQMPLLDYVIVGESITSLAHRRIM